MWWLLLLLMAVVLRRRRPLLLLITVPIPRDGLSAVVMLVKDGPAAVIVLLIRHRRTLTRSIAETRRRISKRAEFRLGFPSSLMMILRGWRRRHYRRHMTMIRSRMLSSSSSSSFPLSSRQLARRQNPVLADELDGDRWRRVGVDGGDRVSRVGVRDQRAPVSVLDQRPGMTQDKQSVLGSSQGNVHTLSVGQEA